MTVLAERVMSELDLRLALRQQKLMRREIDHRVKNSLASVSAIIGLQSSRAEQPGAREALDAVQSRISALEALHEELHQDSDSDEADLSALVDRAVSKLRKLVPERLAIETAVDRHALTSEEANAVALIVNEFITNSAKHGFGGGAVGTIRLEGTSDAAGFRLLCSDDGSGGADSIRDMESSTGLGSRIIRSLAASIGARTHWSAGEPGLRLELSTTGSR